MLTSTTTCPFAGPTPPPCPMVVLLHATDLVDAKPGCMVLAHEDLPPRPNCRPTSPAPNFRYHPYPRPSRCSPSARGVSSPLSSPGSSDNGSSRRVTRGVTFQMRQPISSPPQHVAEPTAVKIKLPRPKGAGRIPLHRLLNWEPVMLEAVKVSYLLSDSSIYYLLNFG
jgi:hypothetical protein